MQEKRGGGWRLDGESCWDGGCVRDAVLSQKDFGQYRLRDVMITLLDFDVNPGRG